MLKKSFKMGQLALTNILRFRFLQTKLTQQKLKDLKISYKVSPSLEIFKNHITSNSDYFRIFQVMQKQPFVEEVYLNFRKQISELEPQNDNILLLRAKTSSKIAQNYAKNNKNQDAERLFNQALQILEQSLLPNIMQYYSVYRQYGIYLSSIGNNEKAAEVLSESVQILREYVKHSDDPITANYHSIQQAKACVKLIYLQPEERQKWLKMANNYWRECEHSVYEQIEYAQTVYENTRDKIKTTSAKKGRLYADVELEKINNEKYHKIIQKAFEEVQI